MTPEQMIYEILKRAGAFMPQTVEEVAAAEADGVEIELPKSLLDPAVILKRAEKPIDHNSTREMVCPYCGNNQDDPWEHDKECGTVDCDACECTFNYSKYVYIEYTTEKQE